MEKTVINIHTGFKVGKVDERIFGGFLEHIGRAVYEGVYDPKSKNADEDGFRRDVMDTLKNSSGKAVCKLPPLSFAALTFKVG